MPIPKQKSITINNKHLRPISLTPTVFKVQKSLWCQNTLPLIDPNQYGAIPKSSTVHVLVSMIYQWAQATGGTGSAVRVILFDFKKAFDLIDHHILLRKLRQLAIPRENFLWVTDFLMDRFQRVKLSDNCYSEWA